MYLNLQEFYIFTLVSLCQCIARPAGIAKNLTRTARASFHKVFQKRDVGGFSPLISWHWDVQTLAQELQDTKLEFFKALVFDHATNVMLVVADWVLHMQCGNYRLFCARKVLFIFDGKYIWVAERFSWSGLLFNFGRHSREKRSYLMSC